MNQVGVPAVAGDTGGRGTPPRDAASATAAQVQAAPGTNRSAASRKAASERKDSRDGTRSTQSKPGRPQFAMTDILPAKPASWYSGRGPNGPCIHCRARILRRIEREGGASIRVLHEEGCRR
jgi:hypothetical protein